MTLGWAILIILITLVLPVFYVKYKYGPEYFRELVKRANSEAIRIHRKLGIIRKKTLDKIEEEERER